MRSVVVERKKQENILDVDKQQAMEIVLEKIRGVIATKRKAVENSLIATGSPIAVRSLNKNQFNAAVMNRLGKLGKHGNRFRNDMTKLVVVTNGNQLVSDGFFKVGSNFPIIDPATLEAMQNMEDENITGLEETSDGGVQDTREGQDVGQILGGSANILHEIGGIIGLFTGTGQQSAGNNFLNTGGQIAPPPPPPSKTPWTAIIIGLVVIATIVGVIVYMKKKKK